MLLLLHAAQAYGSVSLATVDHRTAIDAGWVSAGVLFSVLPKGYVTRDNSYGYVHVWLRS